MEDRASGGVANADDFYVAALDAIDRDDEFIVFRVNESKDRPVPHTERAECAVA